MLEQNRNPDIDGNPHVPGNGPSHVPDNAPAPSLEIANAIARLHKQYVGRGPTNARVTIDDDLVVCLLEGGYTKAEQTLENNDKGDIVAAGRLGLQDAMRTALIASVETTLGRRVRSFMSANDLKQNLQVEVFVLHGNGADPARTVGDGAVPEPTLED